MKYVPLLSFLLTLITVPVVFSATGPPPPLALLVEVEGLGRGHTGTVMGLVIQIAPEDIQRAGDRIRVVTALTVGTVLADRQSSVVEVEADGSVMLYRDWPVGDPTSR